MAERDGSTDPGPPTAPAPEPEPQPEPEPEAESACASGQIDINAAGFEELQDIVHVGPDRAQQIIDLRPFSSVDALTRVSGIAEARLRDIQQQGVACAG